MGQSGIHKKDCKFRKPLMVGQSVIHKKDCKFRKPLIGQTPIHKKNQKATDTPAPKMGRWNCSSISTQYTQHTQHNTGWGWCWAVVVVVVPRGVPAFGGWRCRRHTPHNTPHHHTTHHTPHTHHTAGGWGTPRLPEIANKFSQHPIKSASS